MTCIRRAPHIDPHTVRTVVDRLARHVAPHLSPDISNYAGGRAEWIDLGELAALDGRGLACWCHPTLPRSGTRPARCAATNSKKSSETA